MAEIVYEGMFILDSNRYGQNPDAVSGGISQMIEGAGGTMLVSRLWEERRLAYPIKGHRRGTYWLAYFRLDSQQLVGVSRQCKLNENILRELFLKVDPRIVDALVTHAQAATPSQPRDDARDKPEAGKQEAKDEGGDTENAAASTAESPEG